MQDYKNYVLQLSDTVTTRRCALRIEPEHSAWPLRSLLDYYLKYCPIRQLLDESRITESSAETLQTLQDLVYIASDDGQLRGMFAGISFKQADRAIELDDVPETTAARVGDRQAEIIDIAIDRLNVGYDRNWTGFHKRRWDRNASLHTRFVLDSLEQCYSPHKASVILGLKSKKDRTDFLRAIARRIWESQFESYSRFTGRKLIYKMGDETVQNIVEGAGGICSEKVQALKFITDQYGLQSEYLLAGAEAKSRIPEDKLRELLTTFDFRFAKRYMRYWQHTALLYTIDDSIILVDATNGNIPFLFLEGDAARRVLGSDNKQAIPVKMAVRGEDFYYHRVSQDIVEKLYFAMEGWIPDADLIQVFDNELGLYISEDFFVTPIVFKGAASFERLKQEYVQVCADAGLECSVNSEWTLDSNISRRFVEQEPETARKILDAEEHLLKRYDECHGPGHEAGLVIIGLRNASEDLRNTR